MDKSCHLVGALSNSSVRNDSSRPTTGMSSLEFELCCTQKTNRMTTTTIARRELRYDGFSELAGCS